MHLPDRVAGRSRCVRVVKPSRQLLPCLKPCPPRQPRCNPPPFSFILCPLKLTLGSCG